MKKLTIFEILFIGAALFAGHFGVGNTIFPMKLGYNAGSAWVVAAIGYCVIDALLPMLTYYAVSRTNSDITYMVSKVFNSKVGKVYGTILMLILGPIFISPRVASAVYEMSIVPFFPQVPLWAMLLVYFALTTYVCFNPSKVMDRIGHVLAPTLLVAITIIFIKGIINPIAAPADVGYTNAFGRGFNFGYNTMDAITASLFGGWLIKDLKMRGITDIISRNKSIIKIGLVTMVLMILTQFMEIYLGASASGALANGTLGTLPIMITTALFGKVGVAFFAILMALACFTTSAGGTTTSGHYFVELSGGRFTYKQVVIACSIVSFILSNVGLEKIVGWTLPWLTLAYPSFMVIVLSIVFKWLDKNRTSVLWGAIVGLIFGFMEALGAAGINIPAITNFLKAMPLGKAGFDWLLPVILAMIIGAVVGNFITPKKPQIPLENI